MAWTYTDYECVKCYRIHKRYDQEYHLNKEIVFIVLYADTLKTCKVVLGHGVPPG